MPLSASELDALRRLSPARKLEISSLLSSDSASPTVAGTDLYLPPEGPRGGDEPSRGRHFNVTHRDPDEFSRCLMAGTGTPQVLADMDAGAKPGVRGTPSLLVNGSLLPGVPDSTYLMDHIEAAIRETAR